MAAPSVYVSVSCCALAFLAPAPEVQRIEGLVSKAAELVDAKGKATFSEFGNATASGGKGMSICLPTRRTALFFSIQRRPRVRAILSRRKGQEGQAFP